MNSEDQFEVRHYLSKTLQLFIKSTGSVPEWSFSTIYLSLVGLFPIVGHTKKAVIPTPGLFIERKNAVSFKHLCKNIENLTYIASTKKLNTHTLKKKTNNRRYYFTRPEILRIHTHTHKKTMKSLKQYQLTAMKHTYQLRGMASTLRMHTTISPGRWQPWTAVSPLLGLISMA